MGLDGYEIILEMEKTFELEISDDDLKSLGRDPTAGDLYNLLLTKLHLRDVGRYNFGLNHRLWTEMQHTLYSVTCVPKQGIELGTPLERIFPSESRREQWTALREACPYRIAELDYPAYVRAIGFLLAGGVFVVEQFHLWQLPVARVVLAVVGFFGLWMASETYLKILSALAPLRSRLPVGMRTVKDLCRAVLSVNYTDICATAQVEIDDRSLSVWDQLVVILSKVIGVPAESITFRSRLEQDLGMA